MKRRRWIQFYCNRWWILIKFCLRQFHKCVDIFHQNFCLTEKLNNSFMSLINLDDSFGNEFIDHAPQPSTVSTLCYKWICKLILIDGNEMASRFWNSFCSHKKKSRFTCNELELLQLINIDDYFTFFLINKVSLFFIFAAVCVYLFFITPIMMANCLK